MRKKILVLALTWSSVSFAGVDITFPDPNLTQCLQEWASDPINNYQNPEDVHELACAGKGIRSLEGIEQLPELYAIDLSNNPVTEYSPLLHHKDHLGFLWIWGNTMKCADLIKLKSELKRTLIGGVDFDSCLKD